MGKPLIRSWEESYCFTYNPPKESSYGKSEGIGIFLKKINTQYFQSFNIYLHEKGQFWPGNEHLQLGQTEKIVLKGNTEITGNFDIQHKERMSEGKCESNAKYSFTDCVLNYLSRTVGCMLGSIDQKNNMNKTPCSKLDQILKYKELMISLQEKTFAQLSETTKCPLNCEIKSFTFYERERKEEKWPKNWTSSFYLRALDTSQIKSTERLSYSLNKLMSDVGGILGLSLGWSVLSICLEGPHLFFLYARGVVNMLERIKNVIL